MLTRGEDVVPVGYEVLRYSRCCDMFARTTLRTLAPWSCVGGSRGQRSGSVLTRQLKGYETFNDALEFPETLKCGFGLVDTPSPHSHLGLARARAKVGLCQHGQIPRFA